MWTNPYNGKFVTFEGIDFSGKSTQIELMQRYLLSRNFNFIFTKEPTGNATGREIYDILYGRHKTLNLESMDPMDMQKKYFMDRRDHYQNIVIPALREGIPVLCDRGVASMVFGVEDPYDIDRFLGIEKAMFENKYVPFFFPNLILIYDIPAEVAIARAKNAEKDKFENLKKQRQVRQNYFAFSRRFSQICKIIDGELNEETIFELFTRPLVNRLFGLR